MRRWAWLGVWLVALLAETARADGGGPHPTFAPTATATQRPADDPAEREPLPVPEPSALALRYHATGNWLWVAARLWALAVPMALLFSGASGRLWWFSRRVGRFWFPAVALYAVLLSLVVFAADLPLHYYAGFVRQHAYGLSNQTFAKWFGDALKGEAVELVGVSLFAWVPLALIARFPRSWWLLTSALMVPFLGFVMLVSALFIDPLFNDFGPMKDKALEAKILGLAARAGVSGGRVFEVNKSVDTKTANAYVKGVFGSKRIVLWDTLLKNFDEREVLVVMGHEMGHYVLGHVALSVTLSSVLFAAGLFWVDRAGRWALRRFRERFGFDSLADAAAIPLLLALSQLSSFVLAPVGLAYSRHNEAEADRFALELTHMNRSGARAFADLQRENLGVPYPNPIARLWRGTHPSLGERIEFCNAYRPWDEGKSSRYAHLFGP